MHTNGSLYIRQMSTAYTKLIASSCSDASIYAHAWNLVYTFSVWMYYSIFHSANDDFIILNETVEVLFTDTELKLVGVTFVLDGVAQEPNEVFMLELVIDGQEPTGDNFYFLRNKTLTIRDTDGK